MQMKTLLHRRNIINFRDELNIHEATKSANLRLTGALKRSQDTEGRISQLLNLTSFRQSIRNRQ